IYPLGGRAPGLGLMFSGSIDRRESPALAGTVSHSHSLDASGRGSSRTRITGANSVPFPDLTNVDPLSEAQAPFAANAGVAAGVFPGSARRLCHMALGSAGRKAVAAAHHHLLRLLHSGRGQ